MLAVSRSASSQLNNTVIEDMPDPVVTTTEVPQVPCEFGPAGDGDDHCPEGTAALTEAECKSMPYHFGGVLHMPFVVETNADPWGCFLFHGKYYYNSGLMGRGRPRRTPFCKHCQVVSEATFASWSEWVPGNYIIRKAPARFRQTTRGACSEAGLQAIHDEGICEQAARELMLSETNVQTTCLEDRPEGCYYLRGVEDGKETLWMNVNPLSRGNGVETSAFAGGSIRMPICAAEEQLARRLDSAAPSCRDMMAGPRKIAKGSCADLGREPIRELAACEAAARHLGLADLSAELTRLADKPEGCYYYRNPADLTATLWLNRSPLSKGRAAERLRQTICTAEVASAAAIPTTTSGAPSAVAPASAAGTGTATSSGSTTGEPTATSTSSATASLTTAGASNRTPANAAHAPTSASELRSTLPCAAPHAPCDIRGANASSMHGA